MDIDLAGKTVAVAEVIAHSKQSLWFRRYLLHKSCISLICAEARVIVSLSVGGVLSLSNGRRDLGIGQASGGVQKEMENRARERAST